MRRGRALAALCGLLAAAFLALGAGPASAAVSLPSGFYEEPLFVNLKNPTTYKVAPDGRTFVALKNGEIKVYPKGSSPTATPETFVDLRREVYDYQDHGLLGLALDPGFDTGRPYIYALYSYDHAEGEAAPPPRYGSASTNYEGDPCPTPSSGCLVSGRLVRLTAEGNHAKPSAGAPEEKVLLEGWCQQFGSHSIGDLAFGPEGALYVSGGDGASYENADYGQLGGNPCGDPEKEGGSLRSLSLLRPGGPVSLDGTLLRIDPSTGEGWPGNPLAGSADANSRRIIADGFRNPFRFVLDPRGGAAYVDNVGTSTWEEIDRVPIGSPSLYDSGWPCYEGPGRNPQFSSLNLPICEGLYNSEPSTASPFFTYNHASGLTANDPCPTGGGSAITGIGFYEGSTYPAKYNRALFFADTVRGCIYAMLAKNGEPDPSQIVPFLTGETKFPGVDIEQGPQGEIVIVYLYAGKIVRIVYDTSTPTAVLNADRDSGPLPLTVNFSAAGSASPGGNSLEYAWDLDEDGQFDDATGPTASRTFTQAQNVQVALRVTDTKTGGVAITKRTIYPGDTPPQVQITTPSPSLTWSVGQQLNFEGSATANGGAGAAISPSELDWQTRLLHCPTSASECHEHPLQNFTGVSKGSLVAPNHDFPSYVNFILEATDSRGLSNTAEVKIAARPVTLSMRSQPAGVELGAGSKTAPAPYDLQVIEKSPTSLAAPTEATIGGRLYAFSGWSDGGARLHTIPATASGTYTAVYSPVGGAGTSGPSIGRRTPHHRHPPRILARPAKRTTATTARFRFAGEAKMYQCRLDRAKFAGCRSPRVYRHLHVGHHTIRIRGVDAAGKPLAAARTFSWLVLAG